MNDRNMGSCIQPALRKASRSVISSLWPPCAGLLVALVGVSFGARASAQARSNPAPTFVIAGNTPGFIQYSNDLGAVDPATVITVTVWLRLHNEAQLDALVRQQRQQDSPNYHKWITQDQFDLKFAPTSHELNAVENYLHAKNLSIVSEAENNMYVEAQGTVGDIETAFHVSVHRYDLMGVIHRSNTASPSITEAAASQIAAITGIDDYGFEPAIARPIDATGKPLPFVPLAEVLPSGKFFEGQAFRPPETDTFTEGVNTATYTGNRYGADITNTTFGHLPPQGYSPDEMQTAYNMKPLYQTGLDGTGETIVITDAYGSPTIERDVNVFSQVYGLPPVDLQIVKAAGISNATVPFQYHGWDIETSLDVEWAHAMAPGAKITVVVVGGGRGYTILSPLLEAINYAVVHHLGNTISNSWAASEAFLFPSVMQEGERILKMAASQGIDVNFASGDAGDGLGPFPTVGYPASSLSATGVGGTTLALNTDNTIKFQTGWGNNLTRIADSASLGNPPVIPPLNFGFIGGAGGGASHTFAKPAFQSGIPGTARMVPDIALVADAFTGTEVILTLNGHLVVGTVGGTSLATPMFSGVMAIAAQRAGHGLGQAASLVYNLPAGAVSDIVPVGSPNNVTGVINGNPVSADQLAAPLRNTTTYYTALYNDPFSGRWSVLTFGTDTSLTTGSGWDNVTGVGTPNGINFVNAVGQ